MDDVTEQDTLPVGASFKLIGYDVVAGLAAYALARPFASDTRWPSVAGVVAGLAVQALYARREWNRFRREANQFGLEY